MTKFKQSSRSSAKFILFSVFVCCACVVSLQAQCNGSNVADEENYRVRSIKVNALFGSVPQKLKDILAKHRNELFQTTGQDFVIGSGTTVSGSSLEIYRAEVTKFFEEHSSFKRDTSYGVNQQNGLYIRATYYSPCVKIVPIPECEKTMTDTAGTPISKCLDVIIKIRVIPINTANPSSNLLDLARSNQLRFYRELPRPLLAFDPNLGIEQDKSYGTSIIGKISTEIFSLPSILRGDAKTVQKTQLQFSLNGRKSFQKPFYNANAKLRLSRSRPLKVFEEAGIGIGFVADRQPRGDGILTKNATGVDINTLIRLKSGVLNQISLGANYRRVSNRFSSQTGISERTTENVFAARAITDGKVAEGFIRGGIWFDSASPNNLNSYRRTAAMLGYAKNFPLSQAKCQIVGSGDEATCVFPKKNAPVIGVEMILGAGKAWGNVPQYARFYGGNTTGNFLYDAVDEPDLINFPDSVLIRSFGRNQAGVKTTQVNAVRGGTSYSHFNLSVSLPVRAWSRPLIPAAPINDRGSNETTLSCADCTSLKDVLKKQVDSGKNIYIDAIALRRLTPEQREDLALVRDEGLTPEEEIRLTNAERVFEEARVNVTPEADAVWSEITPTIKYIADTANLYSVKPLIMFDAARISAYNEPQGRTRFALGGGLQFNIVVAKFEVGYVRTVRSLPNDDKGNFVVRMVFEKLF